MGPLWVHGFRTTKPDSTRSADVWRQLVSLIVLRKFVDIPAGKATEEAEKGLGIEPSFYWFVGSSKHYYGNGVFLCNVMNEGWNNEDRGISPFDSGGVWHKKTRTVPPSLFNNESDRKRFFDRHNHSLNGWIGTFSGYIQSNYGTFDAYVCGRLPDKGDGIPEIVGAYRLVGVDKITEADSLAWTWEGCAKKGWNDDQITWTLFLCYEEQLRTYKDWLVKNRTLLPSEKKRILTWLKGNSESCDKKESPVIKAQRVVLRTGI